jgi:hypothetical protein
MRSEGGKGMKSDKKKSDKESGKGMKSDKKEKSLHAADGYEVEYEVAINYEDDQDENHRTSKSSKNRPLIPDFEYIEIGYKSSKAGKTSYYGSEGYYESTGVKSGKAVKETKSGNMPSKLVVIAT